MSNKIDFNKLKDEYLRKLYLPVACEAYFADGVDKLLQILEKMVNDDRNDI